MMSQSDEAEPQTPHMQHQNRQIVATLARLTHTIQGTNNCDATQGNTPSEHERMWASKFWSAVSATVNRAICKLGESKQIWSKKALLDRAECESLRCLPTTMRNRCPTVHSKLSRAIRRSSSNVATFANTRMKHDVFCSRRFNAQVRWDPSMLNDADSKEKHSSSNTMAMPPEAGVADPICFANRQEGGDEYEAQVNRTLSPLEIEGRPWLL